MRYFFPCAILLGFLANTMQAAVYSGDSFTWRQPDNTPVPVVLWGDEHSVVIETPDGWTLMQDGTGRWCYARPAVDGGIEPSALAVGAGDPTTLGVAKHLRMSRAQQAAVSATQREALNHDQRGRPDSPVLREARAARIAAAPAAGGIIAPAPPSAPTVSTRHGITLLARFPDQQPLPPNAMPITQAQVDAYCNGAGYTDFGNNGSVKQYFLDNSLNRLTYTNSVTAYFTAAHNLSYYTDTAIDYGDRARELIIEGLNAANTAGFDFTTCDRNSDGIIDGVNLFYAYVDPANPTANEPPNSWSEGLWPHMSTLSWSGDGKNVGSYQITNVGDKLVLGTFCHENGHMLCDFPDVYDYDTAAPDRSWGGAGRFCLMNSGGHGTNPVRVNGYLALAAGWRDVVELSSLTPLPYTVTVTAENATIYRHRNPASTKEYFLFENRFKTSASNRDATLPCSGVAIWHVDELGNHNDQRYDKNTAHQNYEVALVQADNSRHFENNGNSGDASDLWYNGNAATGYTGLFNDGPGTNVQANDARWWSGLVSNLVIDSFSAPGAAMTFRYGTPAPPPPATEQIGFVGTQVVDFEGSSGNRVIYLSIARQAGYTAAASVAWATAAMSATAGSDYIIASGTTSWLAGETADKVIPITVNGDTTEESDEAFTVHLSTPLGTNNPALSANIDMLIVLRNDDGPSAAAAAASAAAIQANGTGDSGACGAGAAVGLLGIGGLGLLRRRRR